jgi:NAD-dependent dihydropyrimidine dehydrogenase PreA subunit
MSKRISITPNPIVSGEAVEIDPQLCTGCNRCVEVCRTGMLAPNPEEGEPPIVLYPDECWYGSCCVAECPVPGAITIKYPLNQKIVVIWKRKETGEYFHLGMLNSPPPNIRPPVG